MVGHNAANGNGRTSIRAVVANGRTRSRNHVLELLAPHSDIVVVATCVDGIRTLESLRADRPDLVLVESRLPRMSGAEVLDAIEPDDRPACIFIGDSDEDALEAFDLHVTDFLLRPFEPDRFDEAIAQARNQIAFRSSTSLNEQLRNLVEDLAHEDPHVSRIAVRSTGRVVLLDVDEIDWIDAAGNYVRLNTRDGSSFHLRETMTSLEAKLDPRKFLRIHRSTIVRAERIKELRTTAYGGYVAILECGRRLTVSRGRRERLAAITG